MISIIGILLSIGLIWGCGTANFFGKKDNKSSEQPPPDQTAENPVDSNGKNPGNSTDSPGKSGKNKKNKDNKNTKSGGSDKDEVNDKDDDDDDDDDDNGNGIDT